MTDEFSERPDEEPGDGGGRDGPEMPPHVKNTKKANDYMTNVRQAILVALSCSLRRVTWFWHKVLANANFWVASATVVIAIATTVYTIYARHQWTEMQNAASAAQATAAAAQQAANTAAQ